MKQRTRIPRKRLKERRRRPELTKSRPKVEQEPWAKISKRVRLEWWSKSEYGIVMCGICFFPITNFRHLVPDHIEPGKMGGCKDNSFANLQPAHSWCNLEKGSKRVAAVNRREEVA